MGTIAEHFEELVPDPWRLSNTFSPEVSEQGRKTLGQRAAARYRRVRDMCPEDVSRLEQRLRDLT